MSKPKQKTHRANQASAQNIRIAPRKARIVVDLVRNRPVEEALQILQFTPKKAAPLVANLIESAIHNVMNSEQLDWDTDDLYVAQAYVNEGPTLRRFMPRAQGRATRINKRTSQITVVLQPRV
ncbi:50S ribosomal protein L22 [Lujinxingia vulgaris]|uniref:Large ribosomal subunit protein uL22 n=1 Tax=Lujinxingia vulgaris TaxID=2600176 RepID=A0A5C6WZT2_9DELT|nr:50S ribosomal protein L22 [Lujinxingia vulgaris]TXD35096.1 50S ribosomal protein L22 [Lujinxingia vulgaris]TXD35409.1 50S ribosomal protein L22 [Lujinxingia vulgaris]